MKRREFLQRGFVIGSFAALPGVLYKPTKAYALGVTDTASPISKVPLTDSSTVDFNGDDIDRPHQILWDRDHYLASRGGVPPVSIHAPIVVVGGGMAGLTAAYSLRDLKPFVLEQDPRFGGNSKGEKFSQTKYSVGAAYICRPDEGSEIESMLQDLNLLAKFESESATNTQILYKNQILEGFWQGITDPQAKTDFDRVSTEFLRIYNDEYPSIPPTSESQMSLEKFKKLDNMNMQTWMDQTFGELHPHITEYLQMYAWSSFGGSLNELSAAQYLNFITAEFGETLTLPGGNAAITTALYEKLKKQLPAGNITSGSIVISIEVKKEGVEICFENAAKELKTILAQTCVVACPKYAAKPIINHLSESQKKAMDAINYRSYIVGNVILKKKIEEPCYDLFCLKDEVPESPMAMKPPKRGFSDLCFGSWAAKNLSDPTVLTFYKALPYDGAEQFLFNPAAHDKNKKQILSDMGEVLAGLNIQNSDILGTRMTRWGHALPLAAVGKIADGTYDQACADIQGRIFFANQDNWANPAFETATESAFAAAAKVRSALTM